MACAGAVCALSLLAAAPCHDAEPPGAGSSRASPAYERDGATHVPYARVEPAGALPSLHRADCRRPAPSASCALRAPSVATGRLAGAGTSLPAHLDVLSVPGPLHLRP